MVINRSGSWKGAGVGACTAETWMRGFTNFMVIIYFVRKTMAKINFMGKKCVRTKNMGTCGRCAPPHATLPSPTSAHEILICFLFACRPSSFPPYSLSFTLFPLISFLVTMVLGVVVSLATGNGYKCFMRLR